MKYQVMPDLTPIEYEALKASISQNGILVPVDLDENGDLLDGHHRVRAWEELRGEGVNLPDYPSIIRTGMTEEQKRNHARTLNVIRRQLTKEQRDEQMRAMRADGMTYQQIADAVGVGVGTVHRAASDFPIGKSEIINERGQLRPATYAKRYGSEDADDERAFVRDFFTEDLNETQAQAERWRKYRVEHGEQPIPHVARNSGNNEWYTPEPFIMAARAVMGGIDCDPATSETANKIVGAATIYTEETNGLAHNWNGRVWMNPPYATPLISQFCEKLSAEKEAGNVDEAIVLVNNATETGWFGTLVSCASAIVFPQSRIRFWQPSGELGAPLQGQALIYIGGKPRTFLAEFKTFGWGAHL